MVFWRSLTKEEFEVKTTCSRSGEILLESANYWDREVPKGEVGDDEGDRQTGGEIRVRIKVNVVGGEKAEADDDGDVCIDYINNEYNNHSQLQDKMKDTVKEVVGYERDIEDSRGHSLSVRTRRSMREISDRLENMLKWLVMKGWAYTILGLALNVVWLAVLMKVQRSISYNPAA